MRYFLKSTEEIPHLMHSKMLIHLFKKQGYVFEDIPKPGGAPLVWDLHPFNKTSKAKEKGKVIALFERQMQHKQS